MLNLGNSCSLSYVSLNVFVNILFRLLADQQVPGTCLEFVSRHKQLLKERNLVKNFIQHLVNLQEFQLISPSVLHQATSILLESYTTNDITSDSR